MGVGKVSIKKPIQEESPRFYDPERDGITFSLLRAFRNCRQLARISLQGWTPRASGLSLTFGSLVHWLLQIVYADVRDGKLKQLPGRSYFERKLEELERLWRAENPMADPQTVQHFELSMLLMASLMPLYFKQWYVDIESLHWEKIESEFKIPTTVNLPDGRVYHTFLRGKMDGVFRKTPHAKSTLFETKTKSRLEESNLVDILPFELQVNLYMEAIHRMDKAYPDGVLYNVIRRPGLRQKKGETMEQFAARIVSDIKMRPDWYFVRMRMKVEPKEIDAFAAELNDLVTDFMSWWTGQSGHYKNSDHCENKYGTCWGLSICSRRDYSGVFKRDRVFRELEEI